MSIGQEIKRPEAPKKRGLDWILWWRVDKDQLAEQVRLYDTLGVRQSMRGIATLCLSFSIAVTVLFTAAGAAGFDATAYLDAGLMAALAAFIYFGHRWAMIGAMIVWSLEKAIGMVDNPVSAVGQILWWAIYMHAFFFAFRIEQERRRPKIPVEVFE